MDTQITLFFKYKTIDSSLLSSNIIIVDDIENSKPAYHIASYTQQQSNGLYD